MTFIFFCVTISYPSFLISFYSLPLFLRFLFILQAPFKFIDRVFNGLEIQQYGDGTTSRGDKLSYHLY
jgi:hypothetical protein